MNGLELPLIPIGTEGSGEFMIFLPAVETDELEEVTFTIDEEEDLIRIACIYGEDEDGNPVGQTYPIAITEMNRQHLDSVEKLIVLHPSDQDVEELTDDPQIQDDLRDLFDYIDQLEDDLAEQPQEPEA
jgi:hypothetical protein